MTQTATSEKQLRQRVYLAAREGGMSQPDALAEAGVTRKALWQWRKDTDFSEREASAIEKFTQSAEERLKDLAMKSAEGVLQQEDDWKARADILKYLIDRAGRDAERLSRVKVEVE